MKIEQFVAAVRRAQAEQDAQNRKLITKIVIRLEANAKRRGVIPRKTGNLARQTNHQVISSTRGKVGSNVNYARYVHDGTSRMPARPYFVWALERTMPEVEGLLRESGNEIVTNIAGGA